MPETKETTGIWISEITFGVKDLSWSEKILLEKMNSLDNSEKGCYASNQFLADFLGNSANSMGNMLSSLVKRGFLIRLYCDGHNRGYRSPLHHPEPPQFYEGQDIEPSQKSEGYEEEPSQNYEGYKEKPSQNYEGSDEPSQKSEANLHKKVMVTPQIKPNEPSLFCEQSNRDKEEEIKENICGGEYTPRRRGREEPAAAANSPPIIKPKTTNEKLDGLQKKYPWLDVQKVRKKYLAFCHEHKREPKWQIFEEKWLKTEFEPMEFEETKTILTDNEALAMLNAKKNGGRNGI